MNHNHRYEKGEQIMFKMIITSLPYVFFKAIDFIDLYFLDIPKDNASRRRGVYGTMNVILFIFLLWVNYGTDGQSLLSFLYYLTLGKGFIDIGIARIAGGILTVAIYYVIIRIWGRFISILLRFKPLHDIKFNIYAAHEDGKLKSTDFSKFKTEEERCILFEQEFPNA